MRTSFALVLALPLLLPASPGLAQHDHHGTATPSGASQPAAVTGTGTVRKVDAAKRLVTLDHAPLPALGWPAMVMDFKVAAAVDLAAIAAGQPVEFTLDGTQTITALRPKR